MQKGLNFLLKIGAVSGSPVTVSGMRSTSYTLNGETVDVTTKDSNRFRELLGEAGVLSMSISASGVVKDDASRSTLRANMLAQTIDTYHLIFDNGDTIEGDFQITTFERSGEYNGADEYSLALESSGAITVTEAP